MSELANLHEKLNNAATSLDTSKFFVVLFETNFLLLLNNVVFPANWDFLVRWRWSRNDASWYVTENRWWINRSVFPIMTFHYLLSSSHLFSPQHLSIADVLHYFS